MALNKITYDDKSNYQSSSLANMYKVAASDMNEIKSVVNAIVDAIYPVGSIYISVTDDTATKVQNRFGGTWVAFATGMTLVGIDTNDSDFDTVEQTGGSKYLQEHQHKNISLGGNILSSWSESGSGGIFNLGNIYEANQPNNNQVMTGNVDGTTTGNSGNLQPYICVYMWKRVS